MEPTDFEKWCAGELGYEPEYIMTHREALQSGEFIYTLFGVETRYRAYMAGVRSMLPYKTPVKGATNELD